MLHVEFTRYTNDTPKACPFYYVARVVKGLDNAPTGFSLCQCNAFHSLVRQLKERGLTGSIHLINKDKGESRAELNAYLDSLLPHRKAHATVEVPKIEGYW